MIKTQRRLVFSFGLLLAVLTAGCGGDVVLPEEGEAAEIEIVSGDDQLAPAGTTLPAQVVVRVLDARGRPVSNADVTFTIGSGGGSVEPATVKSNGAGDAAASWTLGPSSGGHLLRAQTPGGGSDMVEVTIHATAVAGSGSVLVGVSGDEQTGPVLSALADSLVVKTTDALGNPVANVEVTWSVSGGGSISPLTVVTGADGLAAAERVLGPTAGAHSAQAMVNGFTGSPVTFSHTAIPANPTVLEKVSGDGQRAPGGFEVAESLVVRLEDENGNGIGGRAITWVVPAGSGSVDPVNTTTDVNGLAITRWTLPTAVGNYSVSAVFSGLPAVQFTATATADLPTTIELVSGNNQSAAVGTALTNPLVVRVTDANDNPVAGVSVNWTAEGGGSVASSTSGTDASGLAAMTRILGTVPGPYTTTAAVEGLSGSPIIFNSTATVGPPAQLAIITQPGSPTISGNAFNPAPVIQVQDAQGNAVSQGGIEVTASISSGQTGVTLLNSERNTSSNGRATFSNLRITAPPDDDYVLTFTAAVDGNPLIPVSSGPLTVTAGAANLLVIQQQPATTAVNGAVISPAPIVRVEDAAGNPISGNRNILVVIESGPGVLSGTTTVNTNGGATATFSNLRITGTAGPHTLLFSSSGLTSVESGTIQITPGAATSMAIQAGGTTQEAGVNEAVPIPPAVIVSDQSGNPVPGVSVSFAVTAGGGSVDPATVVTGSDGIAAVNSWTLGPSGGTNTLVASIPSAPAAGTETFNANATAPNGAPTAVNDNLPAYTVNEDETLSITNPPNSVLVNDDDPEDDPLTAINPSNPPGGSVTLNANGTFTYTPDPDFNGPDTFTYQASDGSANSNAATVTITVTPVNDPPTFQVGPDQAVSSLGGPVTVAGWATAIAAGPGNESGQTVSFQVTTSNDAAFATLPSVASDGTLTFTPALTLGEVVVTVTVQAVDSEGAPSAAQDFSITISL